MKLRTKYIGFVGIIHGIALCMSYFIFREDLLLFLVAEVLIILSVIIAWRLYNQLIQPLKLLIQGTEAIKDRDFNVKLLPTGKYEMDALIDVYNRMMDELRTERIRQEQQHLFLEKLIHTSPTGILILDYDNHIQQANPKALQLLDIEENEVSGRSLTELSHPIIRQIAALPSGQSRTFSLNGINTYKLQKAHFIDRGFPRHFIMIEKLTAEILAAEKNVYGKVIRMMAHEVNNTIGPVNSIIQSTLQSGRYSAPLTHALEIAMERNHNLNAFMRNFADLVRIPLPEKKPIDLIPLVQRTTDLMQSRTGEKKIKFLTEYNARQLPISADTQLMEQALINIIKNAMEAIEDTGTITILSYTHPRQLLIRNTGKGIPREAEENLFSPFYSTKKDGQGIGLTLVREILTSHGFTFSLKTVAPDQTEFSIALS